jgi:hypothetical protein
MGAEKLGYLQECYLSGWDAGREWAETADNKELAGDLTGGDGFYVMEEDFWESLPADAAEQIRDEFPDPEDEDFDHDNEDANGPFSNGFFWAVLLVDAARAGEGSMESHRKALVKTLAKESKEQAKEIADRLRSLRGQQNVTETQDKTKADSDKRHANEREKRNRKGKN